MLPFSNTEAMQMHLSEISRHVAPKAHGVCMDASRKARTDLGMTGRQIAVLYPAFGAGLSARWP